MNSRLPQITEPTGAASPLERQTLTESTAPGQLPAIHAEGDRGVEDPGAVEVDEEAAALREFDNAGGVLGRQRGAVAAVMGVLQADEAGPGEVDVVGADGGLDIFPPERPVGLIGDRVGEDPAQGGHPARLVDEDVRAVSEDDLLAAGAVGEDGGDVSHRAARDQQPRLHPGPLGRHRLEAVDRGVLAEDVVPQLGAEDRLPHGRGGKGYRIAAQIYDRHRQPPIVCRTFKGCGV